MKKMQSEPYIAVGGGWESMRIAMQMTLTTGMVRLYPPQESVTEVMPSRGTRKHPDRSPGQDFSTVPESMPPALSGHLAI